MCFYCVTNCKHSSQLLAQHYITHAPPIPIPVLSMLRKKAYAEALRIVLLGEREDQRNKSLEARGQKNPMLEYV